MRTITLIIIHCSAASEGRTLSAEACRQSHIRYQGFRDIGYYFCIARGGEIHPGRPLGKVGAHCWNHNAHSIGICYEGGLNVEGQAKDTHTLTQRRVLLALLRELKKKFPEALVIGHHDLNPIKECPCYPCAEEYKEL